MIPGLTRALTAAGVPVEVAGDEIPLAADPAVRPLLLGLQIAARGCARRPRRGPGAAHLAAGRAGQHGRTAARPRPARGRAGRAGRHRAAAALGRADRPGAPPSRPAGRVRRPAPRSRRRAGWPTCSRRCARGIQAGQHRGGGAVAAVVRHRLAGPAAPARPPAAGESGRRANRDLDAVCALFDIAARSEELVRAARGLTGFLAEVEGQQIPADTDARVRPARARPCGCSPPTGPRVWSGTWWWWPACRRAPGRTYAGAGRCWSRTGWAAGGDRGRPRPPAGSPRSGGCSTSPAPGPGRRLVVTAVAGTEGEGDQPSRFLAELGVPVQVRPGPAAPAAVPGRAGRRAAPGQRRPGGVARPARAGGRPAGPARGRRPTTDGRPLVPGGRPDALVGDAAARARPVAPVVPADEPVRLSGQPARRRPGLPAAVVPVPAGARAESARSAAASFGSVVHVLAEHGARTGADLAELSDHLDTVWDQLDFDANWLSAVERVEAESALERFVDLAGGPDRLGAAGHRGRRSAARSTWAASGSS